MASDKTREKLITRKVLCFPASKLDALDSTLDALDSSLVTRSFRVSRIEDRVVKFEFRGTVNLHLHGTVCQISSRKKDLPLNDDKKDNQTLISSFASPESLMR